jgi:hypothetical protein
MRIPLLALVALTEDLPDHRLTRGQIGTVVEQGQTYALIPVRPEQLLLLHKNTEAA